MGLIVIFLFLFFLAQPALAIDAPVLINPSNNATVTSSKLEWQAPSYPIYTQGSPYVVQIKNIPTFTSQDDRYKTNTYYTPKLSDGIWYWRVKAKNSDGIWSDWSTTWSFNLTTSTPTTTSTPSPTPTPTPSASSTTSSSFTSSFTISNTPSQINSDQSFNFSVNLSIPNNPNTAFYLKGAFKTSDGSNYFGMTKVSGAWVKNGSSYASQYSINTDSSGNWSGDLEVQVDSKDAGFVGSGDYIFKVARYTSSGSGPTWSNEITVKIVSSESADQGGTITPSASNNPYSTTNPSSSTQSVKNNVVSSGQSKSYDRLVYHTATVAAATTSANPIPSIQVKNQKEPNLTLWIGLGLVISGIGSLIFIYLRSRNLHEEIYYWFRRRN